MPSYKSLRTDNYWRLEPSVANHHGISKSEMKELLEKAGHEPKKSLKKNALYELLLIKVRSLRGSFAICLFETGLALHRIPQLRN
jgi:hypothetical protein